jgi:hypothetical protein
MNGISFPFISFGDQRNVNLLRLLNGISFPFNSFGDQRNMSGE